MLILSVAAVAQPRQQFVKVLVTTDHADWQYKLGQTVKFTISVVQFGHALNDIKVRYEIRPEKLDATQSNEIMIKDNSVTIDGGSMQQPGFLRCQAYIEVDGKEYTGMTTAAFEPETIKPTTTLPEDFLEFWENAKVEEEERLL